MVVSERSIILPVGRGLPLSTRGSGVTDLSCNKFIILAETSHILYALASDDSASNSLLIGYVLAWSPVGTNSRPSLVTFSVTCSLSILFLFSKFGGDNLTVILLSWSFIQIRGTEPLSLKWVRWPWILLAYLMPIASCCACWPRIPLARCSSEETSREVVRAWVVALPQALRQFFLISSFRSASSNEKSFGLNLSTCAITIGENQTLLFFVRSSW